MPLQHQGTLLGSPPRSRDPTVFRLPSPQLALPGTGKTHSCRRRGLTRITSTAFLGCSNRALITTCTACCRLSPLLSVLGAASPPTGTPLSFYCLPFGNPTPFFPWLLFTVWAVSGFLLRGVVLLFLAPRVPVLLTVTRAKDIDRPSHQAEIRLFSWLTYPGPPTHLFSEPLVVACLSNPACCRAPSHRPAHSVLGRSRDIGGTKVSETTSQPGRHPHVSS